jgi:LPS export ABC transporter protein LptC
MLASCENDLKDVEKIASHNRGVPVDITYGVTAIYSDSAVVKAKLSTPIFKSYKTKNPYSVMPEGVTIIFYDEKQKESGRITSEMAIRREKEQVVEFRKNVVVTDNQGNTFKSEELLWYEALHKIISRKPVVITDKSGFPISGTGFEAPESDLSKATVYQGNGVIAVPSGQGF